jgi:hypothetical protein
LFWEWVCAAGRELLLLRVQQLLAGCPAFAGLLQYERLENLLYLRRDELPCLWVDAAAFPVLQVGFAFGHLQVEAEGGELLLLRAVQELAELLRGSGGLELYCEGGWCHLYWRQFLPYAALQSQEAFNTYILGVSAQVQRRLHPALSAVVEGYQKELEEEERDLQAVESEFNG